MTTLLLLIIYLAFISLGLPDALLGSAWPVMQADLRVPFGFAGVAQALISCGTILSSLFSSLLIRRFGTGRITALSVGLTAAALLGYSAAPSFWWLLGLALPLGLGAGAVDAGLNAYVAAHYQSRHMSWLHSFWGIGALSGPLVLSLLLAQGYSWRIGYRGIGLFQSGLVLVLLLSIPLWDRLGRRQAEATSALGGEDSRQASDQRLPFWSALRLPGVPWALLVFLAYCGIEASMGLWGASYLVRIGGLPPARAATWVSLFYASLTLGRVLTGFLTFRLRNNAMIQAGASLLALGIGFLVVPLPLAARLAGFLLIGIGCAPIFPCMLHETPARFGNQHAQTIMGFQMAVAYIGASLLPPSLGFLAAATSLRVFPWFHALCISLLLFAFHRLRLVQADRGRK